jgi:ferritin-like metal-binding protein YciE
MSMESLRDLFVNELKDLYSAEKQLLAALPKMAKAAASEELRTAFNEHRDQTEEQLHRLERIFQEMDMVPRAKKCEGIAGIIEESAEFLKKNVDPQVRDAALIASAQKAEHYEIAGYGTLRAWARLLGQQLAAGLLQQTLNEESETDERLTGLAEQINPRAEHAEEMDEQTVGSAHNRRH